MSRPDASACEPIDKKPGNRRAGRVESGLFGCQRALDVANASPQKGCNSSIRGAALARLVNGKVNPV